MLSFKINIVEILEIHMFLGFSDRLGTISMTRYLLKGNGAIKPHTYPRHHPEEIRYHGVMSSTTPGSNDQKLSLIHI